MRHNPFPFAITNALWLKAKEKGTKVEVLSTRAVLKDEIYFMLSLKDIQSHFYNKIEEEEEYLRNKEKQRVTNKIQNRRR